MVRVSILVDFDHKVARGAHRGMMGVFHVESQKSMHISASHEAGMLH